MFAETSLQRRAKARCFSPPPNKGGESSELAKGEELVRGNKRTLANHCLCRRCWREIFAPVPP